ncbi:methyltransferase domain-containing protein [Glaciecola sp. XM2]|jgi:tRNA G46 methylase TrmB|uniref:tRNA (guanine(46)-N(7))-methyltransferase TrmB n=1 Tax=Glaciecola sp. XM2 TaxID=1914931 RepID=UPI001BDEC5F8|nr:methyltransferase domain-containing protein [Glaciecola sp. XM2]MBT1450183.1 methyltransferase domain-containing protein [Glaciecola sp. XM2]
MNEAREITSNQQGPHEDVSKLVLKHAKHGSQRPIAEHTQTAFNEIIQWLDEWKGEVYLDACCGVGESTARLAQLYPHIRIIGIDKSASRLQKHESYAGKQGGERSNYKVIQADLNDFWRLLRVYIERKSLAQNWVLTKQFILYPNPYPKKAQVGKRWHASSVFPDIMSCCSNIEVRSNWLVYLQEFVIAAKTLGYKMAIDTLDISKQNPAITPFERKYSASGQSLWTAKTLGTG